MSPSWESAAEPPRRRRPGSAGDSAPGGGGWREGARSQGTRAAPGTWRTHTMGGGGERTPLAPSPSGHLPWKEAMKYVKGRKEFLRGVGVALPMPVVG